MQIIAITGTNGSGKGTLVHFLEDLGYIHFSARTLLLEEITKRNLGTDRTSMQRVGNMLRQEHGPDYIARELLRRAQKSGAVKVTIESIRCLGEVHFLRSHGVKLLAVDDPAEIRYARILRRAHSTDGVSYAEFLAQEHIENIGTAEWDMNVVACVAEADYVFSNNGNLENFRKKVSAWQQDQAMD